MAFDYFISSNYSYYLKASILEILNLSERIKNALETGESHFREFKSGLEGPPGQKKPRNPKNVARDIGETLVAFANADGGELIVGVEDDGLVTGIEYSEEIIEMLLNAYRTYVHKDTPLPTPRAISTKYENKKILFFSVPSGFQYVFLTSDGRCLQRKDLESVPIASEQIIFSRNEIISREYDRKFVENANISDLNSTLVSSVAEHISKGMSIEKCLQILDLVEFDGTRFRLRKAALLLFAKNINQWHPRTQVRILKIEGSEIKTGTEYNVVRDESSSECILTLIESSWSILRPYLTETRFSEEAIFRKQIIYPELACREALINAIAHRDYSIEGAGIEIHVFTDRLEIISPGGLLSTISLADIKENKGAHQSRNSLIARTLRETGYMLELGEGIRRIYEQMKSNDLKAPEFKSNTTIFTVILHHKYMYSSEQRIWLESFSKFNLNREQNAVVLLGYNEHEISPNEIWKVCGITDTEYYRQLIESLTRLGILVRIIDRNRATTLAKNKGIVKKDLPQYKIIQPSIGQFIKLDKKIDDSDYSKIYVVNIPYGIKKEQLVEAFRIFGEIVNIEIPINFVTGFQRGFAFIEFNKKDSSKKAISLSGKLTIEGRQLLIREYFEKV